MKRQKKKKKTMKDELPRLIGAQYADGEEWRNNIRKNKETEPKQNTHTHTHTHIHTHPVVDMTGGVVNCDAVNNIA